MPPQKLVVLFASLTGGAIGLFAPVGAVKWLMQTEPEEAGILFRFRSGVRQAGVANSARSIAR